MMSTILVLLVCLVKLDLAHPFTSPKPSINALYQISRPSLSQPHHYLLDQTTTTTTTTRTIRNNHHTILGAAQNNNDGEDKFSFFQRIESIKTAVVGLLAGGILSTPFIALHDLPTINGVASWEFDTDMGSLQSALFAIVYRYCIREEDDNEMLNMGVVGAFIVVRTLSRIRVPAYCSAVPLDCGDPLGYFDYDMLNQLALNGLESVALFGGAAVAMEVAYSKKWISKFPN